MKQIYACLLLLVYARAGFANTPVANLFHIAAIHEFFPYPVIEYGSEKDGSSSFFSLVCSDPRRASAHGKDMHDFFEIHVQMRVFDRNIHYLMRHEPAFVERKKLPATTRSLNLNSAEPDPNGIVNTQSTIWPLSVLFDEIDPASSTCQA